MREELNLLCDTIDAKIWADEWIKTIARVPELPKDHEAMIVWFANAIMAGHDHAADKVEKKLAIAIEALKYCYMNEDSKIAYAALTKIDPVKWSRRA